jgi:hypothetical protein
MAQSLSALRTRAFGLYFRGAGRVKGFTAVTQRTILRVRNSWRRVRNFARGYTNWRYPPGWPIDSESTDEPKRENALKAFFDARKEGPGIWKWNHYFDIYDRHLRCFRGREVSVVEIGVYSGGSLEMWRDYFGSKCQIFGIDIEPACRAYESDCVRIFIGDQGERSFWRKVKQDIPPVDIVIDDGGHLPEQQIVTFEELMPHLKPGGVYVCEDVHASSNSFASYVYGCAHHLNAANGGERNSDDHERPVVYRATPFQAGIGSIHLYPYVVVVERTATRVSEFVCPKRGTQWQPFLP